MENKKLYIPFVSKAKNSKYSVYVLKDGKKRLINFGDSRYEDYHTHLDKKRQKSYLARAKGIKDKNGNLTYKNKNTANYWAVKLWGNKKPSWY
jgi:hypothetical protein